MALGINTDTAGGDFLPRVQYDARAGRWSRVDRTNVNGSWESNPVDITDVFNAVFDYASIMTGWIDFTQPAFVLVPLGHPKPPEPAGEKWKEGFRMRIKLAKAAGGDVREFGSTAKAVIKAVSDLHDEYLKGVQGNPGMLPVVAMTGVLAVKTGSGQTTSTNYKPVLRIERWVNRPADMPLVVPTQSSNVTPMRMAPPSTSSAAVPPPQQRAAQVQQAAQPAPAATSAPANTPAAAENDFG